MQNDVGSIWIMGLSASGKTTLAQLLAGKLREEGIPNIILDGDQIRNIFEERLGYDVESRRKQTHRVMRLAKWISGQGIVPVVAIIHPFEDDRALCRRELKDYFEVYLNCPLEVCIKRDFKKVYQPALDGKAKNVIGLDIPYEIPERADFVLESGKMAPQKMLETLWPELKDNFFSRSENICVE